MLSLEMLCGGSICEKEGEDVFGKKGHNGWVLGIWKSVYLGVSGVTQRLHHNIS